jgi:hypothetical protein
MVDGHPEGRKQYLCQSIEYTNSDVLQEALNNGSLYGGWNLVSCTYIENSNSFLIVWSS